MNTDLEDWPNNSWSVCTIMGCALAGGIRQSVDVAAWQDGEWTPRRVEHRAERGWVVLEHPGTADESLIYEAGDIFDAAFVAAVGRMPLASRPSPMMMQQHSMRVEVL